MEARDYVQALINAGLTQKQIEEGSGISQPTISKIITGKVDDVLSTSYRKLQALHAKKCKPRKAPRPSKVEG